MNASSHLKCIFISDLLLNVFVDWILLFLFERLWSRTQQKQWRTLECSILSIQYGCTQNLALDSLFLIYIGSLHLLVSKGKAICTSCPSDNINLQIINENKTSSEKFFLLTWQITLYRNRFTLVAGRDNIPKKIIPYIIAHGSVICKYMKSFSAIGKD